MNRYTIGNFSPAQFRTFIAITLTSFAIIAVTAAVSAAGFDGYDRIPQKASIKLEPCEVPDSTEKALCGTHEVFEDRAKKRGRKISLKIVVFPATGAEKAADPLFYIPGGPGSSATEDAPYVAKDLAKIRERRDLVFLDQRGTGGSHPLNCDLNDPADLMSYMREFLPLAAVKKCRELLEKKADLKLYTTDIAMDDLDEVRAGLGYKKINIMGGSYGTRATLEYVRRYGHNTRAVILHGVAPSDQIMPRDFPQQTERALNGVIDDCIADEACRAAFPEIRSNVKAVLATLLKGPIAVTIKHPETKAPVKLDLSRDLAAEAVRYMLYQPGAATRIPLYLNEASKGNFVPITEAALFYRQRIVGTGSNGMYLSVTCAEDLPWVNLDEAKKSGEGTFLGDYRARNQKAACDLWPRADIPKDYSKRHRSETPALIMTGNWDPVTPPLYGDRTAEHMPNSLHIIVPQGGHGFGGLEGTACLTALTSAFITNGSVKGLDTSCVKDIRRRPFMLKLPDQ